MTQETTLALTRECEATNLAELHEKFQEQMTLTTFNRMESRLQELQLCWPRTLQGDELLKNRLLNAFSGLKACCLARQKVVLTLMGFIANLQISVAHSNQKYLRYLPQHLFGTCH